VSIRVGPLAVVAITLVLLAMPDVAQEKVGGVFGQGPEVFTLATGSPGELGLLKALGEAFCQEQGSQTSLKWIKAGSGESLQLLKDKKVDLIMVYGPPHGGKTGCPGRLGHQAHVNRLERILHRGAYGRPGPNQRGQERH
jgi:tungstate transport system substrate-binding protein